MNIRHVNYPSERSRPVPVLPIPRGRCAFCKVAPQPCTLCRHDWSMKRCRCATGNTNDMPHAEDCPRFEVGHGR